MITTGSGIERAVSCRASNVLPRVWSESSDDATRGTALHDHLERLANGTDLDASLDMIDPKHRGACEAVDRDALTDDLKLSAEVTLVYNPFADTARILGQSLDRDYTGVADDEIPMTLDLVGVNLETGRGAVKDYKSGWGRISPTRRNWQILGGSLALSRVYDLEEIDGELIYLREGVAIRRDPAVFTAADFAVAAADLRIFADRAAADRARAAAGGYVEPTEGSWCRYCPSAWSCPAKIGLIRAAVDPDGLEEQRRLPMTPASAVKAWHMLKAAKPLLKQVESAIMALASTTPLFLEKTPEGVEVWLGKTETLGNEKLDPAIAIDVAAEILLTHPAELAKLQGELADFDVTKVRLDAAVKTRVPKGKGAATVRRILEEVRRRHGASRAAGEAVKVYTRKPGEAA